VKRPLKPALLASTQEKNQYLKEYAKYKKYIIKHIQSESALSDLSDLIVYLSETYHTDPKIRLKKKTGAKTKWSDYLNCAVAVEVDNLKIKNRTRSKALEILITKSAWNKLIPKNSKDPFGLFNKADKAARNSKLYPQMVKARLFSESTNDLDGYYKCIESAIQEVAKKN
jgi:hypothetical protein